MNSFYTPFSRLTKVYALSVSLFHPQMSDEKQSARRWTIVTREIRRGQEDLLTRLTGDGDGRDEFIAECDKRERRAGEVMSYVTLSVSGACASVTHCTARTHCPCTKHNPALKQKREKVLSGKHLAWRFVSSMNGAVDSCPFCSKTDCVKIETLDDQLLFHCTSCSTYFHWCALCGIFRGGPERAPTLDAWYLANVCSACGLSSHVV
jgi:hypothetical protein